MKNIIVNVIKITKNDLIFIGKSNITKKLVRLLRAIEMFITFVSV